MNCCRTRSVNRERGCSRLEHPVVQNGARSPAASHVCSAVCKGHGARGWEVRRANDSRSVEYGSSMPSQALIGLTSRLKDVDELMKAHEAVGGVEPGRRYDVEGLNRASVLLLCAHFEGY